MAAELLEKLWDLEIPDSVQFSPDGKKIVYCTTLTVGVRKGDHAVSTIWLATTNEAKSARKIKSGSFHDSSPAWSPDGRSLAFLSDRRKPGEAKDIYILPLLDGGEAQVVSNTEIGKPIESFAWSPDGKSIAFLSTDEKTAEAKEKEKQGDDSQVYGQDWQHNRLRLLNLSTHEITTLASHDAHIVAFSWEPNGNRIVFNQVRDPDIESPEEFGNTFFTADVKTKQIRKLCHFPNALSEPTWIDQYVYYLALWPEQYMNTAMALYRIDISADNPIYEKHGFGETNCALGLKPLCHRQAAIVQVSERMNDELYLLGGAKLFSVKKHIQSWDVHFPPDNPSSPTLALVLSDTNTPAELYTGQSLSNLTPLSAHGSSLNSHPFGTFTHLTTPSLSTPSFPLDASFLTPSTSLHPAPYPTITIIHGGPYMHVTETFDSGNIVFLWVPLLLSQGYAVLLPNYRSSAARGADFASYGRGKDGAGKADYDDVITLTNHAVELGLADPKRLVIGGWSQGGYMTYLACVRNGLHTHGWKFIGGIAGAGVSDSDSLVFTSDLGVIQAEMAGERPWKCDVGDVRNRAGSAIWEVKNAVESGGVLFPMLILHGKEDERCPVEQAVGFRRAMRDAGVECECVVYKGEGHMFEKRVNVVDLGARVLRFVEKMLGPASKGS